MSNAVIENEIFIGAFEQFWGSWRMQKNKYEDLLTWWDIGKQKIKDISIWAGKKLNTKLDYIRNLENKLKDLTEQEQNEMENIDSIRREINEYYSTKAEAARIRSRENWYEKGEKSTSYFYRLEKTRGRAKAWKKIKISDGVYETKVENILKKQVEFYENLFQSEGYDEESANYLLDKLDITLDRDDRNKLESDLTDVELKKAIDKMANNKAPGEDGIIAEFYKKYWYLIGGDFTQVVKQIFWSNKLCNSQCRGIVTLIYKQGEREAIENWRPITLLNNDYKIIAKALAERLKTVIPKIIHTDQKGFVQGRKIDEGVRLIQDMITLHDEENRGGAIIFLDQKKAFDRVEFAWLRQVLVRFGFGTNFVKWIEILYKNAESCILTNGFRSKSFKLSRSVRQGCPIAPYLYIIQAEPLLNCIRKNDKIEGIKLPKKNPVTKKPYEAKTNAFADDTQLFVSNRKSPDEIFKIIEIYEKASGASANYKKTVGMLLGTWRNKPPPTDKIKWEDNVKALGITHGYNINIDQIWNDKLEKIKRNLKIWETRDLTYQGRILLIKSLGISVAGYEIQMKGIPSKFIKPLKEVLFSFLWKKKQPLVNKESVCLSKLEGGLDMLDVESYIKTKQIKWIHTIIESEPQEWNIMAKHWLQQWDSKADDVFFITKSSDLRSFSNIKRIPQFYREALQAWADLQKWRKIANKDDILNEPLFSNHLIQSQNKPVLFYNWLKSKICRIQDIWDNEENNWLEERKLLDKLTDKSNWMTEYLTLRSAIPRTWVKMLKNHNNENELNPINANSKLIISSSGEVKIDSKPLEKTKNKCLQFIMQQNYTKPKCINHWNTKFSSEIPWKEIWENLSHSKCERKVKDFQWKSIHNVINTKARLKKMHKGNGLCKACGTMTEDQIHLFLKCPKLLPLIEIIKIELHKIRDNLLTEETIILGYHKDLTKTQNMQFSNLIFNFKWEVWKNRNRYIFENTLDPTRVTFRKIIEKSRL